MGSRSQGLDCSFQKKKGIIRLRKDTATEQGIDRQTNQD